MTARFPVADLVALMRLPTERIDRATRFNPWRSHRPTDSEARVMLAVSGSMWLRYKAEGLTPDQAERLAVRCGFHPAEVWPDWYWRCAELERAG